MLRVRQVLVVLAGLAAAGVMVALGLWQLGIYRTSGAESAADRAAAPAVPIDQAAPPNVKITDGFGRTISFAGQYDPSLEVTASSAAAADRRIVGGVRLDDG